MKILFCSWGNICEPDMCLSLRNMGHHVEYFKHKINNKDYDADYLKLITDKLINEKYDCVFSANYIPIISRACNILKTKYISWTVDSPLFQLNSDTVKNVYNYIFIFDKVLYENFKQANPGHIFYMPLGTNVKYWDTIEISNADKKRFSTDVSFVGSLYEDKHDYDKVKIPDRLKGYFEGVMEAQLKVYGYNLLSEVITDEMADEYKKYADWNSIGEDYDVSNKEIVVSEFLGKKCSELERTRTVDKLSKNFKFDLYTLSNTDKMPYVNNKGPVDSRLEMPKVFKCSKININMTIKTIVSGIPLRIYDVMGCGGFLITNYQSELMDFFVPGEDLVIYESIEDLVQKVLYYLRNEDERIKIANKGYEKVKNMYTYEHRLKDIIEIVWGDVTKCYANSKTELITEYKSIIELFEQLKINSVIDIGLFLGKNKNIAQDNQLFVNVNTVDGLELINTAANVDNIYNNVYKLTEKMSMLYDFSIAIDILKYLKDEEILFILELIKNVCGVILVEYQDNYIKVLNGKYSYNTLEIYESKFILITL